MAISRQFATTVTGTASIILIQFVGLIDTPLNLIFNRVSSDLGFNSMAYADVVLKAQADSRFEPGDVGAPRDTKGTGTQVRYQPPKDLDAPSGTRGTGSRGSCGQAASVSLSLLVPKNHTGLTASGHPTFFWYLSADPGVPINFTLVEPGVPKPIIQQQIDKPKAGINQLQMPKDLPELVPGRQYRWTVTLLCNPDRPSVNPIAQARIKRVQASPALLEQLAAANSDFDKAAIYAGASLWYDTLAAISAARTANPNDQFIRNDFLLLLETVGLKEVTDMERQQLVKQ